MIGWKKKLVLIACGVAICATIPASSCEAQGLFGWLRARKAERQAFRTAYYGGTTAYYGGSCCQPAQTCQPACGTCQQVVAQYAPQTCYRNSWTQVSVTNYRPVQSVDPCTGCPVTTMQPCTSYRWALQRVPYTSYRPVYSQVSTPCSPCGGCATGGCSSCSSCGTGGIATSGTCSSCTGGATTIPTTTVPGQYYQGGTTPSSAVPVGTIPSGGVPAEVAPSLAPTSMQSGETIYRPIIGGSSTTRIVEEETDVLDITPIPDYSTLQEGQNRAPQLLDEDDRRASLPIGQGVPAHLISWSHSTSIQATSVQFNEPAPATVELEEDVWDDTGWEAVH